MWQIQDENERLMATCQLTDCESTTVEAALRSLHSHISAEPERRWIIDAQAIERISSLAIAQLIATVRAVDLAGGRICMIHCHDFVANVLRTTRIVRVLPLYDSREEAIDQLSRAR